MPKFRLSSTVLSQSCMDLHQNGQDIAAEDANSDSKRYSSCGGRKPDVVHWKTKVWVCMKFLSMTIIFCCEKGLIAKWSSYIGLLPSVVCIVDTSCSYSSSS